MSSLSDVDKSLLRELVRETVKTMSEEGIVMTKHQCDISRHECMIARKEEEREKDLLNQQPTRVQRLVDATIPAVASSLCTAFIFWLLFVYKHT